MKQIVAMLVWALAVIGTADALNVSGAEIVTFVEDDSGIRVITAADWSMLPPINRNATMPVHVPGGGPSVVMEEDWLGGPGGVGYIMGNGMTDTTGYINGMPASAWYTVADGLRPEA